MRSRRSLRSPNRPTSEVHRARELTPDRARLPTGAPVRESPRLSPPSGAASVRWARVLHEARLGRIVESGREESDLEVIAVDIAAVLSLLTAEDYTIAREVVQRGFGGLYLIALASAFTQFPAPLRQPGLTPGPALHRPDHRRAGADALPVEAVPVFGRPPAPGDRDRNGPGRLGDHRSAPGRTGLGADPGVPGDVGPVLLDRVDRAALLRLRL